MSTFGDTDFDRIDDDAELQRQTKADEALGGIPRDWHRHAVLETGSPQPPPRGNLRPVTVALDEDVIAFFRAKGRGWQTHMNAVLRAFVDDHQDPLR